MAKWYCRADGTYAGRFADDAPLPAGYTDVGSPPSHTNQIWDGAEWNFPIAYLLVDALLAVSAARDARLLQGIIWKLNNVGDPHPISLDDRMRKFFSYTAALRGTGRTDSHDGNVHQGALSFSIDDVGIDELSIFAAEWGLAIQRIALDEQDAAELMDVAALKAYDASLIDWDIDWSVDSQNNGMGWDNDTVLQNP